MSLRFVTRFLVLAALLSVPASAGLIYSVGALQKTITPACTYPASPSDPYCISSDTTLFLSLDSIDQFGGYQDWNLSVAANTFTILLQPGADPEVLNMEGTATIRVYDRSDDDTGLFNAEILDLEMLGFGSALYGDFPNSTFSGNPGSNGYLAVTDNGGTLEVESYFLLSFDFAFNDISMDDAARAGSQAGFASAFAPAGPPVPEPSTFFLVAGAGLAGIVFRRRK